MAEIIKRSYSNCLTAYNKELFTKSFYLNGHSLLALEQVVSDNKCNEVACAYEKCRSERCEIHLITKGRQSYIVNGEQLCVEQGNFLIIFPDVEYSVALDGDTYTKYRMRLDFPNVFPFDTKSYNSLMKNCGYLSAAIGEKMSIPIDYLFAHYSPESVVVVDVLSSCMNLFLKAFAECIASEMKITESEAVHLNDRCFRTARFCNRVSSYVYKNMSSMLTLDDVANHFSISSRQINRKLQKYYKMSFKDVVANIKCDYAKQRLQYTHENISEIAAKIGYGDTGSFIRMFKRIVGQTPANYKKNYLEKESEQNLK